MKTFRKQVLLQNFFDFSGYGRASRRFVERNVDSRPETQLNGAEAPFMFCSETHSWCVIEQEAQHFVRSISEMRDHTQEHRKSFAKENVFEKILLLELSGDQYVFGNDITQES